MSYPQHIQVFCKPLKYNNVVSNGVCKIKRIHDLCEDGIEQSAHGRIKRGGMGRGCGPSLKNHEIIRLLSNIGPDPLKITKLPSQHSMLGNHRLASETSFK